MKVASLGLDKHTNLTTFPFAFIDADNVERTGTAMILNLVNPKLTVPVYYNGFLHIEYMRPKSDFKIHGEWLREELFIGIKSGHLSNTGFNTRDFNKVMRDTILNHVANENGFKYMQPTTRLYRDIEKRRHYRGKYLMFIDMARRTLVRGDENDALVFSAKQTIGDVNNEAKIFYITKRCRFHNGVV